MAEGQRATGTSNPIYNLSSVLFHALEGGASYDTYSEDAEREGDRELVEFLTGEGRRQRVCRSGAAAARRADAHLRKDGRVGTW